MVAQARRNLRLLVVMAGPFSNRVDFASNGSDDSARTVIRHMMSDGTLDTQTWSRGSIEFRLECIKSRLTFNPIVNQMNDSFEKNVSIEIPFQLDMSRLTQNEFSGFGIETKCKTIKASISLLVSTDPREKN